MVAVIAVGAVPVVKTLPRFQDSHMRTTTNEPTATAGWCGVCRPVRLLRRGAGVLGSIASREAGSRLKAVSAQTGGM
jgi:hypothetical protein